MKVKLSFVRLQFSKPEACVVAGCKNAPASEVLTTKRERAEMLRSLGTTHVCVCAAHEHDAEVNRTLGRPMWQGLLFAPGPIHSQPKGCCTEVK
jgi:hypothetical protein